jgi:hypothetical protein
MTTENNTDDLELEVGAGIDPGKTVEIDLETGKEAEPVVKAADERDVEDEGIKSLKGQMEAMRAAKDQEIQQAKTDRQAAIDEATKSKTQVGESNYQVIISVIEATKREGDQAEVDYKTAMENGDFAASAKAQRIMARVESRLDQLDGARQNIELERKTPPKVEGAVRAPEPQRAVDPVDALAGQLSAKSASWVRQHPECATDPVLFQEMVAADARAKRLGHAPDSPEYFNFIEQRLGFSEPERAAVVKEDAPQRRAVPSAPVSREAPGTVNQRRSVTLSAEEQEIAQMNDMTNAEYAKHKVDYLAEKARAG